MKAIHYICRSERKSYRGIVQLLIFPEFKIRHSINYNTNNSNIKICRDLFEDRYNKFLENINCSEITLKFPIESFKCPGKYSYEAVSIYKGQGPLTWSSINILNDDDVEEMMPVFKFRSLKYLSNNLTQLLRDSSSVSWSELSDLKGNSIFGSIISKNEIDFPGYTPETFLEILVNPETTPNFGVYLEMKLLKRFNLI